MDFFSVTNLPTSVSDCVPLDRARFCGGESWTGEEARLDDRLVVLASGFVGLAGAGLAVPLVDGRGAARAAAVPVGPTEEARVDRRRGGWVDMAEMVQEVTLCSNRCSFASVARHSQHSHTHSPMISSSRRLLHRYQLHPPRDPCVKYLSRPISHRFTVCNPATGEVLCSCVCFVPAYCLFRSRHENSVDAATSKDVDTCVARAHAAYQSGVWSRAPPVTRSTVLSRLAQLLEKHTPTMANIETLQTGRAIREMTAQIGRLPEWLCVSSSMR